MRRRSAQLRLWSVTSPTPCPGSLCARVVAAQAWTFPPKILACPVSGAGRAGTGGLRRCTHARFLPERRAQIFRPIAKIARLPSSWPQQHHQALPPHHTTDLARRRRWLAPLGPGGGAAARAQPRPRCRSQSRPASPSERPSHGLRRRTAIEQPPERRPGRGPLPRPRHGRGCALGQGVLSAARNLCREDPSRLPPPQVGCPHPRRCSYRHCR